MAELPVTPPLAGLIPAIPFQNLDEFLDFHSGSDLEGTCRITSGLTGPATEPERLCRRGAYRVRLNPLLGCTELDFFDGSQIYSLSSMPELVVVLHQQPAFGRTAKSFG